MTTGLLKYNEPVVLDGQLFTDFFHGRPGYGLTPATDEVEHSLFLGLDRPIRVEANASEERDDYDITEEGVDRVQLAYTDYAALGRLRGHGVRLQGRLYHSHTGHHHVPVLLSLEGEPRSIDERGLHSGARLVGTGSGFLLGNDGLIGTAAHVLDDADLYSVTRGLYSERASLVAINEELDLAVLKIEPHGVMANVTRHREAMVRPTRWWMRPRLGERVYAFGFPLSGTLPHSLNLTEGLISSERGLKDHLFQVSAAIQSGNSGGPVFDEYGNLIGMAVLSLEPAQTLNFCVHGRDLYYFCRQHGAAFEAFEKRDEKISPVHLGDVALHICVEVEAWSSVD